MQMVFQDPMSSLDPRQSVESLLVEGMRAHGLDTDKARPRARLRELLDAVGLPAGGAARSTRTSSPAASASGSASPGRCASSPS